VPRGEFASLLPPSRSGWRLDSWYRSCAWIVIGVGYLSSGIDKLSSPSWLHGTALRAVLTGPMSRWDLAARAAERAPDELLQFLTWAVLALEIGFIGLIWSKPGRLVAWFSLTIMH